MMARWAPGCGPSDPSKPLGPPRPPCVGLEHADRSEDATKGASDRRAVEDERPQLALEIGLHLQELQAEHLGCDRNGVIGGHAGVHRLIYDLLVFRGRLGDE